MTESDVRQQLAQILAEDFSKDPGLAAAGGSSFRGDLGMDSLDVVDLVFFVKQAFGVDAKMEEYRDLHTVDRLVHFVVDHRRRKAVRQVERAS